MANIFEQPLEISQLLSHPFLAAAGADSNLAYSTLEFIRDIGFNVDQDGNLGSAIMLEFNYQVSNIQDDNPSNIIQTTSVNTFRIPLLAIVTPPTLRIQRVEVDLVLEVNQLLEETSSNSQPGQVSVRPRLYRALGRLSSERKAETDSSATYKVKMVAENTGENEALAEIMKALLSTSNEQITPAFVTINSITGLMESAAKKLTIEFINPIEIENGSKLKLTVNNFTDDSNTPLEAQIRIGDQKSSTILSISDTGNNVLIIDGINSAIDATSNIILTINNIESVENLELEVIGSALVTTQKSKNISVL